jgi:hypothetical protein
VLDDLFEPCVNGYVAYAVGDVYRAEGGGTMPSMLFRSFKDADMYCVLAQAWHDSYFPSCMRPGAHFRVRRVNVFLVGDAVVSATNAWRWGSIKHIRALLERFDRFEQVEFARPSLRLRTPCQIIVDLDNYDRALMGGRMLAMLGTVSEQDTARSRCCFCRCCINSPFLECLRCLCPKSCV